MSSIGSSGWKKNDPVLPLLGHKFQQIETTKRRCKVCRLPLNSEVFGPDTRSYSCLNLGCRISRVHLPCMKSITKPCKKMTLQASGSHYRTKSASARGTASEPTSPPEMHFHRISASISESQIDLEEVTFPPESSNFFFLHFLAFSSY